MRSLFIFLASLTIIHSTISQNILAEEEFDAENVSSVTIRGAFCDVFVQEGDKVHFEGIIEGRGEKGDYEILSDLDGESLRIEVKRNRRGRAWNWNTNMRSKLELTLPANTDLTIDNSSGDIKIYGISANNVRIDVTSGDLEMEKITADLDIESTSGDVEIKDLKGRVISSSTSGDQDLRGIIGDVALDASSGDIEIVGFEGKVEIQTTSGEIYAKRGRGAMSFRSTSGNIDGYGLEITDDFYVRASSGDIEIELNTPLSKLNWDLETASGDLDVGSRSAEKDLYIKEGNDLLWVKGETTSGDIDFRN